MTSFCEGAFYRHRKCTANAFAVAVISVGDWGDVQREIEGLRSGGAWGGAESLPSGGLGACLQRKF